MAENELSNKGVSRRNESSLASNILLVVNVLTHLLILVTVITCLGYAVSSEKIGHFETHIILCVLGYQFLMCQGTLVLSRYNIWSGCFTRSTNKLLHQTLQLLAVICVVAGSALMYAKKANFKSAHAIFALVALIASLISLLNGFTCNSCRYFHYCTGILTLYLSAICLCFGLNFASFKIWAGYEESIPYVLMAFTLIFTTLVSLDFFVVTKKVIVTKFK